MDAPHKKDYGDCDGAGIRRLRMLIAFVSFGLFMGFLEHISICLDYLL